MKNRIVALWLSVVLCFSLISTVSAAVRPGDDVGGGDQITTLKPSTDTSGSTDTPGTDTPGTDTPPNTSGDYNYTPGKPSYSVGNSTGTVNHGSWSTDKSSAGKGDTVTITATPDDGYQVDKVTVKDAQGKDVAVTANTDGKYTFTMPGSHVTISVIFMEVPVVNPFTDVRPGDFYDAIMWAVSKGITKGTTATTFSPDDYCTRAQIVTFLWRTYGEPTPTSTVNPFTDVEPGDYYNAILWAVEKGITKGTTATTFSPNDSCTRAQAVTFQFRASDAKTQEGAVNPFTDVESGDYYGAILWAVEKNITKGTTATTFSPNDVCTRAQIVTFLYRAQ